MGIVERSSAYYFYEHLADTLELSVDTALVIDKQAGQLEKRGRGGRMRRAGHGEGVWRVGHWASLS